MTGIELFDRSPYSLQILVGGALAIGLVTIFLYWASSRALSALYSLPGLRKRVAQAVDRRRSLRRGLLLAGSLLTLTYVGGNLWLLFRGEDLAQSAQAFAGRLPEGFWHRLPVALAQVCGLVLAALVVSRLLLRLLDSVCARARLFKGLRANDKSIEQFFSSLRRLVSRGTVLVVVALSAWLLGLPAALLAALVTFLKIYLIITGGLILWQAVDAVVATIDALSEKYAHSKELGRYYDRLKPLVPLLRSTIEYLIYLMVASLAVLQIEPLASLAGWGSRLMRILGFFFLTRVVIEVVNLLVEEILTHGQLDPAQRQRRLTLVPLLRSFLQYGLYFVFMVLTLDELGMDPTPLLAGAGVLGLVVGFGVQSLFEDMVAGLFILFEEYFLVGDYIQVCDARGIVESIDLRTTRIRDDEGRHHILRNGEIGNIVNYSKEFTCAVVEVGVAYGSDLGQVTRVLEEVGREIREAREDVMQPTRVEGVEVYAESSLILRTATRVRPGRHRRVERDLRRRIKEAFEQHGIEIAPTVSLESMPFPSH
jgi:small conductance mechanosensitive channel